MTTLRVPYYDDLLSAAVLLATVLAALGACYLVLFILGRLNRRLPASLFSAALKELRGPALLLTPVSATALALPFLEFSAGMRTWISHALAVLAVAGLAWSCIRGFDIWRDMLTLRYRLDVRDNLHARQLHTQVQILRRIAVALVGIVASAVALMTFPEVRAVGTTLFASAGVAGLVIGLAARPAVANLLAGLQVALTEPIRIDDVVVVEGEWGWIEEIRTSYVVVRIWDLRRLVLPLSYFMEKPFENWTRRTANVLGTVFLHADYSVPVDAMREELHKILQGTKLWDGNAWGLQVTDATAQTVELRALVSAVNGSDIWDLRCFVREELLKFLQTRFPEALPKTRVQLEKPVTGL